MPAPRTLTLTIDARHALEHVRARDRRPYVRERAAALLQVAAGRSVRQVAAGLLRPRRPETVSAWLDRYLASGMDGLVQLPRRRPDP